jgi:hypothetical protein
MRFSLYRAFSETRITLSTGQRTKNPMEIYEIKHPTPYACIPLERE